MRVLMVSLLTALLFACASHERGPQADDRYVIVYTGGSRKAEGIFPVQIYNIDGREITAERNAHRLTPGIHAIKARALVDRSLVPGVSRDLSRGSNEPLVVNLQSGYRYFIGVKAESSRRSEWQLVVWKKEPVEAGTLDFDN